MNISSVIVHARPEHADAVRRRLLALAGVEVHAQSDVGKMIVTLETADERSMMDRYEEIGRLDDVMSVAMVYHQTESEPEKEI